MTPSRKLLAALGLCTALTSAYSTVGCSRQGEGDRCSLLNGDRDCRDGLTCRAASTLQNSEIDRCCPDDGDYDEDVCAPRRISGSGGQGGDSGQGGAAGETGAGGGTVDGPPGFGDDCNYSSQCPEELVCTLGGVCGFECLEDRDCGDGLVCSAEQHCVASGD
jgi:hypothetical protein